MVLQFKLVSGWRLKTQTSATWLGDNSIFTLYSNCQTRTNLVCWRLQLACWEFLAVTDHINTSFGIYYLDNFLFSPARCSRWRFLWWLLVIHWSTYPCKSNIHSILCFIKNCFRYAGNAHSNLPPLYLITDSSSSCVWPPCSRYHHQHFLFLFKWLTFADIIQVRHEPLAEHLEIDAANLFTGRMLTYCPTNSIKTLIKAKDIISTL